MIDTSAEYKDAIRADSRSFTVRVEIDFPEGTEEFTGDDIIEFSLLEEARGDGSSPLGFVTSNEFTLALDNSDRRFSPSNPAKQFTVLPGLEIRPYIGIVLPGETVEEVPLGVFWTDDWETPSQNIAASTTAHDRLLRTISKDVPLMPAAVNVTVGQMFGHLFDALDEDAYIIDPGLDQAIRIGWVPRGKAGDAMKLLAEAGNCFVSVNRYNEITVQPNFKTGLPLGSYTDHNSIFAVQNPRKMLDIYSAVRVGYRLPYIKRTGEIMQADRLRVPSGVDVLDRIEFSSEDVPALQVDYVHLTEAEEGTAVNSEITQVNYGATDILLTVDNSGSAEDVNVIAMGVGTGSHTSSRTAEDAAAVASIGYKELTIFNPLIQSREVAQEYAEEVLSYVSDPASYFAVDFRGDPSLEVGDIITIQSDSDLVPATDVIPQRIELTYDGGLSATMRCRKV